jgi:hypothetical protein
MITMSQALTLMLPDETYGALVRACRDRCETPETVASRLLASALSGAGIAGQESDLTRAAVEEKHLRTTNERVEAFRKWNAPWRDREDIGHSTEYINELREDDRIERLRSE